jgi:hypothetical protein
LWLGPVSKYSVMIPLRTISAPNAREHWAKKAKRVKAERQAAYLMAPRGVQAPCEIKITRIAPRMMDGDNLQGAMKGVRDGIADRIGIDDGDNRLTWVYGQRKGKTKEYAVFIEISEY